MHLSIFICCYFVESAKAREDARKQKDLSMFISHIRYSAIVFSVFQEQFIIAYPFWLNIICASILLGFIHRRIFSVLNICVIN